MLKISAIIMASGKSSRMGVNKLFLDYQGKTFLEHSLSLSSEIPFFERILVISPENLHGLKLPKDLKIIQNLEAEKGQSTSVRLGTKAASGGGYLYLTVDQPLLNRTLIECLLPAYSKEAIVFPVDKMLAPCSPIFFGNKFRTELLKVTGKNGGRAVRNRHPEAWHKIQVADPQRLIDIDTPTDYIKLVNQNFYVSERKQKDETASVSESCSYLKP
ncbi:molybdenum cofactor cytidylyltransferase [Enterococcus sp. AZ170]|uniref:NTP transferase domain-containing protein n=1 Tax=Enterococcus sp. AZ170 TaxID=2774747 RepID=UPI003D301343